MRSVIKEFQAAVDSGDARLLEPLLHPDVRLLGSVSHTPFEGRDAVLFVFGMLIALFENARYVSEFPAPQGLVLLMQGTVSGLAADGLQVISVDDEGRIIEFLDFVRPLSALTALQDSATRYLADLRS